MISPLSQAQLSIYLACQGLQEQDGNYQLASIFPLPESVDPGKLKTAMSNPVLAQNMSSLVAYTPAVGKEPEVVNWPSTGFTVQILLRLGFHWNMTSAQYLDQMFDILSRMNFLRYNPVGEICRIIVTFFMSKYQQINLEDYIQSGEGAPEWDLSMNFYLACYMSPGYFV